MESIDNKSNFLKLNSLKNTVSRHKYKCNEMCIHNWKKELCIYIKMVKVCLPGKCNREKREGFCEAGLRCSNSHSAKVIPRLSLSSLNDILEKQVFKKSKGRKSLKWGKKQL